MVSYTFYFIYIEIKKLTAYSKYQWFLGLEVTKDDLFLSDSCNDDDGYVNSTKNGMAKAKETSWLCQQFPPRLLILQMHRELVNIKRITYACFILVIYVRYIIWNNLIITTFVSYNKHPSGTCSDDKPT
jgi:hypothetical protein